jgi:hypothetical protein
MTNVGHAATVDFAATATPASGWLSRVIGLVAGREHGRR